MVAVVPRNNVFTIKVEFKLPMFKDVKTIQLVSPGRDAKIAPLIWLGKQAKTGQPASQAMVIYELSREKYQEAVRVSKGNVAIDIDIPEDTYTITCNVIDIKNRNYTSKPVLLFELIRCGHSPVIFPQENTAGSITMIGVPRASPNCRPLGDPFATGRITSRYITFVRLKEVRDHLRREIFRRHMPWVLSRTHDPSRLFESILGYLWSGLLREFMAAADDLERLYRRKDVIDFLPTMRYSYLEDLLAQIKNTMDLIVESRSVGDKLVLKFLQILLPSCLLLFGCVFRYPFTNREPCGLENPPLPADYNEVKKQIRGFQFDLFRLQVDIAVDKGLIPNIHPEELRPRADLPLERSDNSDESDYCEFARLRGFIFRKALEEASRVPRTNIRPYCKLLCSLRGEDVEAVFRLIRKEMRARVNDRSSDKRDALRRLSTHLAQDSGRLPSFIWVKGDDENSTLVQMSQDSKWTPKSGSFGSVKKYTWYQKVGDNRAYTSVAIKTFFHAMGSEEALVKNWYLEILTCLDLDHPNVVKIHGVARSKAFPHLSTVMSFVGNGNTPLSYLKEVPDKQRLGMVNQWIVDIAKGLRYLHDEGIIHGDLRQPNVLIDDKNRAVIADFGLSVFSNGMSSNYHSSRASNTEYAAPELLQPGPNNTSIRPTMSSDVYAFGVLCIHLYTGATPMRNKFGFTSPNNFGMPTALWRIVEKCVYRDATMRPDMHTVVQRLQG